MRSWTPTRLVWRGQSKEVPNMGSDTGPFSWKAVTNTSRISRDLAPTSPIPSRLSYGRRDVTMQVEIGESRGPL